MTKVRSTTIDIIKWTDVESVTRKCLHNTDGVPDHDTLCGVDLNDPGETIKVGTQLIYERGKPNCEGCISIAQGIVDRYL